jgi:hypothetical protein
MKPPPITYGPVYYWRSPLAPVKPPPTRHLTRVFYRAKLRSQGK